MKMKKLISALVVAAQVFTLSVVPSITAQAEATTNLGLVYYQEAETATDWNVVYANAAAEADADGHIKYTPNRTFAWGNKVLMTVEIPFTKPITFEDGKVIVIETVVKATAPATGDARYALFMNRGDTGKSISKDGLEYPFNINHNHNLLMGLYKDAGVFKGAHMNGRQANESLKNQSNITWPALSQGALDGNSIIKMVAKLDVPNHKGSYEYFLKGADGNFTSIGKYENADMGYITQQSTLNNVYFSEHANAMADYSIDYVKVYNMPAAEKDNYTAAGWQQELIKVESEIQGGEVIADVLTYTKDESFDVKFNAEMDTDSITGTSMYIVAEGETDPVDAMVLYNETTKTATITPDPRLETGDYTLVLENTITTEAVYPAVAESLKFAGAEYDFHYNATGVPVASLPKIVHDGDKMKATFTYNHEDGIEPGTHTYQWKMSATEGGTYNPIDDATAEELLYTTDMNGKWFKVEITPYDDNGLDGAMVTTPAFQGPVAPVATEYEITGTPVAGKELTAKVKWTDANPYDAEGVHNYQWLVNSLEAADTFTEIGGATEKTYVIPEGSAGLKYKVKIQPVSVNAPFEGEWVTTGATAAVTDIKSATNMISNSGFESGNVSPWTQGTNGGTQVLETVDKDDEPDNVYEGEKSLHYSTSVGYQSHGFTVTIQKEKIYLVQAAIKAAGAGAIASEGWRLWQRQATGDAFKFNAAPGTYYNDVITSSGAKLNIANEWKIYEEAFATYKDATDKVQFYSNSPYGFYLDNLYFAELIVSGVKGVNVPATVQIPEYGKTTKVSLGTPSLVNQLGSQTGLDYAKATVRVKGTNEAAEVIQENGIYYLVLNDKAVVGDLEIEAGFVAAENHRMYKNVADYLETYTISLTGTGNKTPQIRDTSIAGTVNENDVIEMDYVFYQEDGDADLSVITWYYKSTPEGTFEVIPGETSKDYQVTAATANGYFRASVLPKTATAEGTLVYTEEVGAPTAPSAKNVAIAGDPFIGETLTGSYDFYDYNKDAEGATTFRWLRAATADGAYTPIGGATATTYVLTEDDIDMFLKFEVTPIAEVGPQPAEGTKSAAAFAGPALPTAENVKITKSGSALLGSYDYKGNAPEGKSLYRWIVDGTVVSTTASYIPAFRGTKLVTFEVTPVASKEPSVGETVAVSLNIQGGSSGSTGGTSGPSFIGTAGGGTMNQAPVTSITQPEVEVDNSPSSKVTDIETHWGYDAIKWALDNEIMESATDTTFDPNALVSRENVIRYLAKLAGFEPTESKGIFADVEGEFADILQTFVDKGIISVDENFRPADSLSRQELCKIFALTLGLTSENAETTSFADNDAIGTWAVPHVNAMTEAGFIKGVGANSFSPQGDLTKAQMATLLQRAQATLGE